MRPGLEVAVIAEKGWEWSDCYPYEPGLQGRLRYRKSGAGEAAAVVIVTGKAPGAHWAKLG